MEKYKLNVQMFVDHKNYVEYSNFDIIRNKL